MNKMILLSLMAMAAAGCTNQGGNSSPTPAPAVTVGTNSASGGSEGTGGGDTCEDRIQSIRDNIRDWIKLGLGPAQLQLPQGVTVDDYKSAMQQQISAAKIACVSAGDPGYPVQIQGTAKTCRFDKTDAGSKITCDFDRFLNQTSDSDQYVLVHHEFAGLAGLESPDGDVSTYTISNQIAGFLEEETVLKLPIVPPQPDCIGLCDLSVSPGSLYTDPQLNSPQPTLILGHTDNPNCAGDMCDSCAASNAAISATSLCSLHELQSTTNLTFTFMNKNPAMVGSTVFAKILGSSNTIVSIPVAIVVTAAHQTMSVSIPASTLITSALGASTFQSSTSGLITVGWGTDESTNFVEQKIINVRYRYAMSAADASATFGCNSGTSPGMFEGLCYFDVSPGDQKASITSANIVTTGSYAVPDMSVPGDTSTADVSGIMYSALRFYYVHTKSSTPSTNFTVASGGIPGENSYQDIPLSNGVMQTTSIMGLKNFAPGSMDEYQFAAASIDQAGIVSYFVQPTTAAGINYSLTPTGTTQAVQPHP